VNAAEPALAEAGESEAIVGTGFAALIVNVNAFEVTPEGGTPCARAFAPLKITVGVNICTDAVPAAAMSAAVIAAVSCVELTNVVARLLPFHCATEVLIKLLPFKVNVNAAPPAIAEFGAIEVSAGIGVVAVNVTTFEVPPPGVGFTTVTGKVPAVIKSPERSGAVTES
jgi:hypothetical protein